MPTNHQGDPILEVRNLHARFYTDEGIVSAVDGVDLDLRQGETLGLVGESGGGKTVTALSIMRLLAPPGRIEPGSEIWFGGRNLLELPETEMAALRGNHISMIFQQPHSSLNPVVRVGQQVAEVLDIHRALGKEESLAHAVTLLKLVGIPDAQSAARRYPHQLSGGLAQRIMIAMALACLPQILIADEPTTALDVTIQAQILDLMRELRRKMDVAIILITHDLGVIAEMADRVNVMYAGRIQEEASVRPLFRTPLHPYTVGLLGSIPVPGDPRTGLAVIPGSPPLPTDLPAGCRFHPRCPARTVYQLQVCAEHEPDLLPIDQDRAVRCWLYHPDYRPAGQINFGYHPQEHKT